MRGLDLHLHEPERTFESADAISLFLVPSLAFLAACAKQCSTGAAWDWAVSIRDFTGFWLVLLSAFKLADLKNFAATFQTYDLFAKASRTYAHIYPLLELTLGLAFLAGSYLTLVSAATAGVMIFGAAGLFIALRQGNSAERQSPEMASQMPISSATIVANLTIAGLAILIGWLGQP
jgi:hypothetical protein